MTSRRRSRSALTWSAPRRRIAATITALPRSLPGVLPRRRGAAEATVPITDGNASPDHLAPPMAPIVANSLVRAKKTGDPLPNGSGSRQTREISL
jgi:hypothetical protein